MPQHRSGGTVNVGINMLCEERTVLGRIAMEDDVSVGALIRRLVVERLQQLRPEAASQMRDARTRRTADRFRIRFQEEP